MLIARLMYGTAFATVLVLAQGYSEAAAPKDIVTTAVESGSFKTLAAALNAAGLVETLQSKGPFTVFAPSDEAFAKLPDGTVATLLKPENKSRLIAILTYHVVPGKVMASDVVKLSAAATVNGQRVAIKLDGGTVKVDQARVTATDIACSNGTIHVIDQVLIPSADNIPTTAEKAGSFKTLLAAAKAAGLVSVLSADKPLTIFAPTDEAFAKLPAGTVESLLQSENKEKLIAILKFHVVPGRVFSDEVLRSKELKTVQGGMLTPMMKDGAATINGAGLVATDIDSSNGVIHVIDSVMMPTPAAAKGAQLAPATAEHIAQVCPQKSQTISYRVARAHRR